MKKIIIAVSFLAVFAAGNSFAADINGLWKSSTSTFIIYQEGVAVKVLCTYRWENRLPIVWFGEGTIEGNRVRYRLHHTANLAPAGWEDGIHELTLSPDGKTMTGTWRTISGSASGNMGTFTKVGP